MKKSEEKLQLVVEFPSIETNQQKTTPRCDKEEMFNGEGPSEAEVARDMERQVMANNIRIRTLEEQNEKLRKSISFLTNARADVSLKMVGIHYFKPLYTTSFLSSFKLSPTLCHNKYTQ